jgi:hypothetical protein
MRLQSEGAPPSDWLAEVDRALAHPWGTEQARLELKGYRVEGLLSQGEVDEAARVARTLLQRAGAPTGPLSSVARALLERDGCEAATPFLARLCEQRDGVAAAWLADCTEDPVRRAQILRQGLADPRPEVREALQARLEASP